MMSKAQALRAILARDRCHMAPCCWDALSAKMIGDAGFPFTFMSGFAVSAARLGLPDTGLISYAEMADQVRSICAATRPLRKYWSAEYARRFPFPRRALPSRCQRLRWPIGAKAQAMQRSPR